MAQDLSSSKTKRGVWAVDKAGKVLLSFTGGPDPTVDAAGKLVGKLAKE
jgi:peroxiredoxin Q/BCP